MAVQMKTAEFRYDAVYVHRYFARTDVDLGG
jgi:hypothetical protein